MNIYKPAGFWIRLGAALLDYIIVSVPLLLIYWLITGKDPNDSMFISLVVLLYSILLPVFWRGYLIGKRICGIRIVKKRRITGQPVNNVFTGYCSRPGLLYNLRTRLDRQPDSDCRTRRQTDPA